MRLCISVQTGLQKLLQIFCLFPILTMSCRRLRISDIDQCGSFNAHSLSAMTRLTELRVSAYLDKDDSLEELTMLRKLAIDYEHMSSWNEQAFPIVVSDAAKVDKLHMTVHHKVSKYTRTSMFCS